ncbi:YqaA family protein [Orrella sp. 11846]|uniref:YqaA family protein n=1 Tax=Orrella sp. 11846 TaxID=3409913 RepID=UPI003B59CB12
MTALLGLFLTGFLAATLLPLPSEPVLLSYLTYQTPTSVWPAVLAIGLGNTLGAVVTLLMGRGLRWVWRRVRTGQKAVVTAPAKAPSARVQAVVQRLGPMALLMSWLPVVGDPMVLVAGTLRLPWLPCIVWIAIGKFGRYAILAGLWF